MCVGHRVLAAASNALGDFRDAMVNGEIAIRYYDRDKHPQLAWRYVHDVGVAAASHWAIAAWHQGLIDTANAAHKDALGIAARLNHHNTTGYALYHNCVLPAFFRRDFAAVTEYAGRLLEHASRYDLPQWTAWPAALEGAARVHAGKVDDGILAIEKGIAQCEKIKNRSMRPVFLAGLSEAYTVAGRFPEAEKALENALAIAEHSEERWINAELWRLHGALAVATKGSAAAAEAEDYFRRGIDVANVQGSKTLVLRLTVSIARLWADQGKTDEARRNVADALSQIVGGRDTPDLKDGYEFLGEPI
jgi:predicted ATPase